MMNWTKWVFPECAIIIAVLNVAVAIGLGLGAMLMDTDIRWDMITKNYASAAFWMTVALYTRAR